MRRTKKHHDIFALDLGTTKFCLATIRGEDDPDSTPTVETVSVPAQGMKRGMLSDWHGAKTALSQLLESAEKQLACDISRVVVGVAGKHLQGHSAGADMSLEGGVVKQTHIRALVKKVETKFHRESAEILHIIPVSYRVDNRETVENPIGFSGQKISGEFFLIYADRHYLRDVINLCNECGLEVSRLLSEPFASASVTVPDGHKKLGVSIADIGGGTTDGMVFQNGKPANVFTINVAGQLMTNDIAIGLNIPFLEAEKVKVHFGLLSDGEEEPLVVQDIKGCMRKVCASDIRPILLARINELRSLIARELYALKGCLGGGILLTGGGAEVSNIDTVMEKPLGITVQKVKPSLPIPYSGEPEGGVPVYSSKYATVVGLLNLEIGRLEDTGAQGKARWSSRYLNQFVNWIKEMS